MRVALPLDFDVCSTSTTSGCSTTSSVFGVDSGAGGVGGAGPSQYSVRLTETGITLLLCCSIGFLGDFGAFGSLGCRCGCDPSQGWNPALARTGYARA